MGPDEGFGTEPAALFANVMYRISNAPARGGGLPAFALFAVISCPRGLRGGSPAFCATWGRSCLLSCDKTRRISAPRVRGKRRDFPTRSAFGGGKKAATIAAKIALSRILAAKHPSSTLYALGQVISYSVVKDRLSVVSSLFTLHSSLPFSGRRHGAVITGSRKNGLARRGARSESISIELLYISTETSQDDLLENFAGKRRRSRPSYPSRFPGS